MPKKKPRLGQNFLIDESASHRIAGALGDIATRTVVEIGPGHGAITSILATRAARKCPNSCIAMLANPNIGSSRIAQYPCGPSQSAEKIRTALAQ